MKKIMIAGIVAVLLLAMAVPLAFAAEEQTTPPAPARPFIDQSKLTDDQLKELQAIADQMFALQKQMINKYVEFGAITQEQADAWIKRMEEKHKWQSENGFLPGMGRGMRGGHGGFRHGWSTKTPPQKSNTSTDQGNNA